MRVLVTGSRKWPYPQQVYDRLDFYATSGLIIVVHGDCSEGADRFARRWCWIVKSLDCDVTEERHPAKWRVDGVYNRWAGFARNTEMVELGADVCEAFIYLGSRGATDCADKAEAAGIHVVRHEIKEPV